MDWSKVASIARDQIPAAQNLSDDEIISAMRSGPSGWSGFMHEFTGGSASDAFAASEAKKARDFNAAEAQKARDFEERMSSTAYQRAAADMRAAGINPAMLAGIAAHAGPASTPSGQSASASSASSSGGKSGGVIGAIINGLVKIGVAAAATMA